MTFIDRIRSHMPSAARPRALLGALLFGVGWLFVAQQHTALWQRLPPSTVERFVADRVSTPLPMPMPYGELRRLCGRPASWLAGVWPSRNRSGIADCLVQPGKRVGDAAALDAQAFYGAVLTQQIAAAQGWLAAYRVQSTADRSALQEDLRQLQKHPPGPLATLAAAAPMKLDTTPREPVGSLDAVDQTATTLQAAMTSAQRQLAASATDHRPAFERARALGLAAAGLQLVFDYGLDPPEAHLTSDRRALADASERQRRGQAIAAHGFTLERLHGIGSALFATALLLMVAVFFANGPLCLWAAVTLLLGIGSLLITDVALTGDTGLRYLADRQFLVLGTGGHWLDLTQSTTWSLCGEPLRLWWPLLLVALALLALRLVRDGEGWLFAPLRAWVRWGSEPWPGAFQAGLLWTVGAVAVVSLGMPAALSELLIGLGCIGIASYAAGQAAYANTGAGLQWRSLMIVGGALAAAIGLSMQRGDLGHALVAVTMGAFFAWLFGNLWIRWGIAGAITTTVVILAQSIAAGRMEGLLAMFVNILPAHAQARFQAMFDPLHADSSDLARVHWLMASAGSDGWGPGYVPWQGLTPAGLFDGLPLQGPSDYVLALAVASWGRRGGLALMAAVLIVFLCAAVLAARCTLRPGMPPSLRFVAAVGLFGCVVVNAKILMSVGGVLGTLPLTGLPVALLGYGPVSLAAALGYLTLATGLSQAGGHRVAEGHHLRASFRPHGAVRRRGLGALVVASVAVAGLLGLGWAALRAAAESPLPRHLAMARFSLATSVASALTSGSVGQAPSSCAQLREVSQAWEARLRDHPQAALHLDLAKLLVRYPVEDPRSCRSLARALGGLLDNELPRWVRQAAIPEVGHSESPPAVVTADPRDYSTSNPWWGLPGCVASIASIGNHPETANCSQPDASMLHDDPWLTRELGPRLQRIARIPMAERTINHRPVSTGPVVGITLNRDLQAAAQRVADCYTGHRGDAECAATWPADSSWRHRYVAPGALRAGAIGIVLTEVDSGRIVALAGALSGCSASALAHRATPAANGRMPALRSGQACAQFPDKHSNYLLNQHPAMWMVSPGSSLKPLAVLAGVNAGLVGAGDDPRWKRILAESHDQASIQALALRSGQSYLDALTDAGFDGATSELLWGGEARAAASTARLPDRVRWPVSTRSGQDRLRTVAMPFDMMQRMRLEVEAGMNIDKRHGPRPVGEFLAARRLADASVGGGDLRVSALGLADVWRRFDLRARGRTDMPALHLLERNGQAVPETPLRMGNANATGRILAMTSGVTASDLHGTAQGACRIVFGHCGAQGLPDLSGKTGTSDFLVSEGAPWVKDGLQIPAKLFGGVFSASGRRYAIAVMALRVRESGQATLELQASAPAEAALTVMRLLGAHEVESEAAGSDGSAGTASSVTPIDRLQ